ncbi:3-hydroxyacyl-CoA dehydrogenase family protein [Ideonella margarita]|uniref:3-hydroxyacyl-CoA dehydrogenase NAD-binding domain-containing protein n=1 Tax=Ideonella margarita TaxID=2984191 RepID=A0ABU9C7X4_9BURK
MSNWTSNPLGMPAVVVGGGTMGADVAVVLARGGCHVTVVEPHTERHERLVAHGLAELAAAGVITAPSLACVASLDDVDWADVGLVVECITERLADKQALFARLDKLAPPGAVLTSNSSGIPISRICQGLPGRARMLGLHFFMPAHLVPLVEVVMGEASDPAAARAVFDLMRACGSVPVMVRKDLPGFLANRLQHALAREAFALIDQGVASADDVDAAVRFGFGFRFLAAGPVLQRDHAGLDVHCAAASTIYPSLNNSAEPAQVLQAAVAAGRVGMKAGAGFHDWPDATRATERARYDSLLRAGLALLSPELPRAAGVGPSPAPAPVFSSDTATPGPAPAPQP